MSLEELQPTVWKDHRIALLQGFYILTAPVSPICTKWLLLVLWQFYKRSLRRIYLPLFCSRSYKRPGVLVKPFPYLIPCLVYIQVYSVDSSTSIAPIVTICLIEPWLYHEPTQTQGNLKRINPIPSLVLDPLKVDEGVMARLSRFLISISGDYKMTYYYYFRDICTHICSTTAW